MSHWKSLKNKLKTPAGYVFAGATAALASVLIYLGMHVAYQSLNHGYLAKAVDNPASAETKTGQPPENLGASELKKTSDSFRSVATKVGPAVVNIKATKGSTAKAPRKAGRGGPGRRPHRGPEPDEEGMPRDPFFDFFEQFRGGPFMGPQADVPQTSMGSGIIIDKKGIVVTNNHVVEDASEILISLNGEKSEIRAKVLGTDPRTDLAVLKLESNREFPAAEWADSEAIDVGDWAIAIGSPFSLGQSVTVGIVSAKSRNSAAVMGADFGNDLIQTDAAINPGNSGGPLCDINGRVMGVNTAIYTRSGGYMGIGFAIPSNMAKEIVDKLMKDGKVTRGWLGVLIQPLDPEIAKELGVKEGVGVHEVLEGSPAETAGIKAGDVVIEVEGKIVKEVTELQRVISGFKPGQTVKMKVVSYGDKKARNISVKIGEYKDEEAPARATEGKSSDEPDRLGVVVAPTRSKEGVVVDFVQPGSAAEMAGIEVGDIVLRVNRKAVNSVKDYAAATKSGKRFAVELKRKGRALFYQFSLPE